MRFYILTHTKLGRILRKHGCQDALAHIRALKSRVYKQALTPAQAIKCECHA